MAIIYKTTFSDPEGSGFIYQECTDIALSEDEYETVCKDWSKYSSNVTVEKLMDISYADILRISRKIVKIQEEISDDEHINPPYEVSPLII